MAGLAAGLERADSIAGDCHKWLKVPYDSGFFFTRRGDLLERAQEVSAAYLAGGGAEPAMMSRTLESSQRFRALPAWMTLIAYGRKGVVDVVRANCAQAARLAEWIETAPGFTLLGPARLNVVVLSVSEDDGAPASAARNGALLAALARGGKVLATPGAVGEQAGIRMCFSNWLTGDADLPVIFEALTAARASL
ncbi:MAG: pyridoxal-dependent decarboxylase [Alphaproteobacteria bacterium]